jgi:Protein of unknown function (DUF3987)
VSRKLHNWIDSYLEFTDASEPAQLFRKGCGLSVVASVLQRKCWIPFRRATLYPNLYIILVGGTGVRKGTAFGQAQRFVNTPELGIKLAVDSTSKVQLIKDFVQSLEMTLLDDGTQSFHSSLTIHCPELTVFLGYQNLDLLTALIDWYDSNKNPWVYRTGNAGNQEITGVWANILGASTPDLLRAALPLVSIGGGLIGRMLLLFSPGREKKIFNDLPTKEEDTLEQILKEDLRDMSQMRGAFRFTPEFLDMSTEFYANFEEEEACKDHRFEGYFNRKVATLYKLSMLFSACRDNTMSVTEEDFKRSTDFLEEVEKMMYYALQGIGRNALADITTRVMMEIGRTNGSTIQALMDRFKDDLSRHELDSVIQTLIAIKYCNYYINTGKLEVREDYPYAHNGQVGYGGRNIRNIRESKAFRNKG